MRDEDHGETGLGESWEMGRGGEMSVQDGKTVRHRVSRKWHEKNMAAETAEMQFVLFGGFVSSGFSQLLRDFECWISHCSVISMLSFSLQEIE